MGDLSNASRNSRQTLPSTPLRSVMARMRPLPTNTITARLPAVALDLARLTPVTRVGDAAPNDAGPGRIARRGGCRCCAVHWRRGTGADAEAEAEEKRRRKRRKRMFGSSSVFVSATSDRSGRGDQSRRFVCGTTRIVSDIRELSCALMHEVRMRSQPLTL